VPVGIAPRVGDRRRGAERALVLLRVRLLRHLLGRLRLLGNGLRGLGLLRHDLTDAHPLQLLDGRNEHVAHLRVLRVDGSVRILKAELTRE
jgi:hypothetical protein